MGRVDEQTDRVFLEEVCGAKSQISHVLRWCRDDEEAARPGNDAVT